MDIEEAFQILALPLDASEEAIQAAYRLLSQAMHPDKPGGDSEGQKRLNEARERAIAYTKVRHAVIPINTQLLAHNLRDALAIYATHSPEEKARALHRRSWRPLNRLKWVAWGAGGVSGIFAVLQKGFLKVFDPSTEFAKALGADLMIAVAFACGLVGTVCQMIIGWDRHRVESFLEHISDKKECASELAQMLGYKDLPVVRETDIRRWRRRNTRPENPFQIFSLYATDLSEVLITKSVQLGLLSVESEETLSPETVQKYRVRFKPSLFEPAPAPPLKPLTEADHRSGAKAGAIMLLLFGLPAIYLAVFQSSLWSILLGLIGLGGLTLLVASITQLRAMRDKSHSQ